MTGRTPLTEAQTYLSECYYPEPLSVCQLFGEELGSYHARIDDYEMVYLDLVRKSLQSPNLESAEENLLVRDNLIIIKKTNILRSD